MSDCLGRHTNPCSYCDKKGYCPQCKGRGFIIEDYDEPIKGIRKGDILLIKSRLDFPIGWLIRHGTGGHYNHVAWFIDDKELIELKSTGKRKTLLSHYLNRWFYKCKVVRPQLVKCKVSEAIRRAKKAQFNYPYSSSFINYLLIKFKLNKKPLRLSCSGFIAYYLSQVGFEFCNKNYRFVTPKDIEFSKKCVNIIKELSK